MQFGNTKTISGQVPWDTTTSSNVMQLTAYPFFNVESGSTYSLEGTYNGAGSNIQIVDGTFTTLDELDLTFSVPSELIGQTGASFILMFEDTEQNRDYFVYNVTGLTLEADPRYKFAINNTTTGVTFVPNNTLQLNGATTVATGVIPWNSTENPAGNYLTGTVTTNKPVQGEAPSVDYGVIRLDGIYMSSFNFTPGDDPGVANYSVNVLAPFTTMAIELYDPNGDIVYCSQTIDGSALTLEAAPTPPTPSAPDFDFIGFEEGEGWDIYKLRNDDDQTIHYINREDACTLDISYVNQQNVSGHTQYNYSTSEDGNLFLGMNIWSSATYGLTIMQQGAMSSVTAILSRESKTSLINSNPLATTGEFLCGCMADQYRTGALGRTTNAFVCFYCDFSNENTYHYLAGDSTNISQNTLIDISSALGICFILAGATAQNIPQNNLTFKLYNSTGSDYVIVNIDMSNVNSITTWPT